jgi:TPR repeat protein
MDESSLSSLFLALWLADDERTRNDTKVAWFMAYAAPLAQAIRVALGYRQGYGLAVNAAVSTETVLGSNLTEAIFGSVDIDTSGPPDALNCEAASSYYFSVSQYSASHFSKEFGVDHPRGFRFEDAEANIWHGSHLSAEAMSHTAVDAALGDARAIVWLAQRYLWGDSLLVANETLARVLFEKAAAQGDSEALLFLGTFYSSGKGGVEKNSTKALHYYLASANSKRPSERAFHALGNYYAGYEGHVDELNLTLAKHYFVKSAELGSPGGHYSYAVMLSRELDKSAFPDKDFARMLYHLVQSASASDTQALNYLGHGLFDPEGWLGEYYRKSLLRKTSAVEPTVLNSSAVDVNANVSTKFKYTYGQPIYFMRDNIRFEIPYPYRPSCKAALPLLKYLADMFYRAKQLSKLGTYALRNEDLWSSIDLIDEAAGRLYYSYYT